MGLTIEKSRHFGLKELKTGSFPTFLKLRDLNEKTKQYHCRQNTLLENVIIVREQ